MARRTLPRFIEPMAAKLGQPFDSDEYLYEIKWDGFRAVAYIEKPLRIVGRRGTDFTGDYPELKVLTRLPAGTVLDGEIVVFSQGKPSFHKLLQKRNRSSVSYMVFDLLYDRYEPLMHLPCEQRRERLRRLIKPLDAVNVVLSEGVVGQGIRYYEQVVAQGLEGVVAKRRDSPYEPGRRSGAWVKFKARQQLPCAIIGWLANDRGGIKCLLVAAVIEGQLQYAAQVGSGMTVALEAKLLKLLKPLARPSPVVACKIRGTWVEPTLLCTVSFNEWTPELRMRAPVLEKLHVD